MILTVLNIEPILNLWPSAYEMTALERLLFHHGFDLAKNLNKVTILNEIISSVLISVFEKFILSSNFCIFVFFLFFFNGCYEKFFDLDCFSNTFYTMSIYNVRFTCLKTRKENQMSEYQDWLLRLWPINFEWKSSFSRKNPNTVNCKPNSNYIMLHSLVLNKLICNINTE